MEVIELADFWPIVQMLLEPFQTYINVLVGVAVAFIVLGRLRRAFGA